MTQHPYGWLSLLPPLVAIVLAIATRRIVLSLVLGIFAGSLVMAGGDPLTAIYHTWETHLWRTFITPGKLRVFSFTLLMGAMVGVISASGGMRGLVDLVSPFASNRRRGQLATWLMGLLVFFDDYANTMLLGSTLRPICDRLKISREKLAYLVDSTAAPVAGLAPLSTWVAVEIDYIGSGLDSIGADGLSSFGLFLASIPYRFYIWSALLLVPMVALLGRDFGSMVRAERAAHGATVGDRVDETEGSMPKAQWYHAVLPIAVTLALVVYLIYDTGARGACVAAASQATTTAKLLVTDDASLEEAIALLDASAAEGNIATTRAHIAKVQSAVASASGTPEEELASRFVPRLDARDVLGEADSSLALQYGALAGLCVAVLLPWIARVAALDALGVGAVSGARVVLPAVAILWTASAMSNMTTDTSVDGAASTAYEFSDHRLYTADYLTSLLSSSTQAESASANVTTGLLPTVVFVLAAVVAFCTGTSWGTMGILVPMVIQTSNALLNPDGAGLAANDPILLSSIGGVLAGAVFGDHCSPISDTTVLSSQSSGCDHLAHVWTQLPYALAAGAVSVLLGTLPIGFGVSVWLCLPLQIAGLFLLVRFVGRRTIG